MKKAISKKQIFLEAAAVDDMIKVPFPTKSVLDAETVEDLIPFMLSEGEKNLELLHIQTAWAQLGGAA
jgi:hypothetical protein